MFSTDNSCYQCRNGSYGVHEHSDDCHIPGCVPGFRYPSEFHVRMHFLHIVSLGRAQKSGPLFSRGPLVICPCILFSVEAWRKCELMSNPLYSMVLKSKRQKVAVAKYNDKDETIKKDTDTYFNQLNASWN